MLIRYIAHHFGLENQINKCKEEFVEFMHELNKKNKDKRLLEDEWADCFIMLLQMVILLKLSWFRIIKRIIYKVFRTIYRIWEGYY